MKLLVTLRNQSILVDPKNSATFLEALTDIKLIDTEGYGSSLKYKIQDGEISVTVFDESKLLPADTLVEKLRAEVKTKEEYWISYYNKANEFEKQLKALQTDLDARGITYTKPEAK